MIAQFGKSLPAAMCTLESALEASLAFYGFPREHWKMLWTNNLAGAADEGDPQADQGGRAVPA